MPPRAPIYRAPRAAALPVYRWRVEDFRMNRRSVGEEPSLAQAEASALREIKRIGRGLNGLQATIFRPGGGGWFARAHATAGRIEWEAWEPDGG